MSESSHSLNRREFNKSTLLAGAAVAASGAIAAAADSPQKRIRTGVIGCGSVSHSYLPVLTKCPYVEVVSLCDIRPERAKAQAERFKIASHYPHIDKMLSGVPFDLSRAAVRIGSVVLFRDGRPFDEAAADAAEVLAGRNIEIHVDLGTPGPHDATVWTCDLSAEYVRINGEYRT